MALSLYEKETIINYNEAESEANIYTASPAMKKRLEKLGEVHETNGGWEINVPKSWIKIAPPRKLTPKHKEALTKASAKTRFKAK